MIKVTVKTIFIAMVVAGCSSQPTSKSSRLRDLAANKNAKTLALIFGTENSGDDFLGGVGRDVSELIQVFQNPTFGFQVDVKSSANSQMLMIPGRAIFASQHGVDLQTYTVYSMIFKNANGVEIGTQSIRAISH